MMSLNVINNARERFAAAQAAASERDQRVAAALEQRKLAQEQPNFRLIVKANGEGDAHAFVVARGFTPGEIARLGDLAQFRVDIHCDDVFALSNWFTDVVYEGEASRLNYADGTLLLYSALHRENGNGYR